jgi:hypothetical protein
MDPIDFKIKIPNNIVEEYRSLSSSSCSFLHSRVTSSLSDPNTFLSTLLKSEGAFYLFTV